MPQADYNTLIQIQERWRASATIPGWKKDGMIALTNILKRRIADNRNRLDGVELYYPEDCNNYDIFMAVACALDALVVPLSGNGFAMRKIGEHGEALGIE